MLMLIQRAQPDQIRRWEKKRGAPICPHCFLSPLPFFPSSSLSLSLSMICQKESGFKARGWLPDRTFHNKPASKNDDQRIWCCLETLNDGLRGSKIWIMFVRACLYIFVRVRGGYWRSKGEMTHAVKLFWLRHESQQTLFENLDPQDQKISEFYVVPEHRATDPKLRKDRSGSEAARRALCQF